MMELTEDDHAIIAKHPMKDTLDHLQDVLHRAKQSFTPSPPPQDGAVAPTQEMPRLLFGSIGQLLFALMSHEVSSEITLKSSYRNVYTELQDTVPLMTVGTVPVTGVCTSWYP